MRKAGGDDEVRYHLNVERVTCVQSQQERVVISCNVRADLSVDALASHIEKMGDAALRRVDQLNARWSKLHDDNFERKSRLVERSELVDTLLEGVRQASVELVRARDGELEPKNAAAFALDILEKCGAIPVPVAENGTGAPLEDTAPASS